MREAEENIKFKMEIDVLVEPLLLHCQKKPFQFSDSHYLFADNGKLFPFTLHLSSRRDKGPRCGLLFRFLRHSRFTKTLNTRAVEAGLL